MIYITHKMMLTYDSQQINNVWEVDSKDVDKQYIDFMLQKAKEINIVINLHCVRIVMNHEIHNNHLTKQEFKAKCKEWKKITNEWYIDKFIKEILKGKNLEYKELNF